MTAKGKHSEIRYEKRDLRASHLWIIMGGTLLLLALVLLSVWWIYNDSLRGSRPPKGASAYQFTGGHEWRNRVEIERKELWELERQRLTSARLLDEANGIYQIPLWKAVDIAAEKGIPYWEPVTVPENNPYRKEENREKE